MENYLDYEINKELGECYLFMGEYDKAQEYYVKAAENTETYAAPYMGLATIAVQNGDFELAYIHYEKALGLETTDKTLTGLGLVTMGQEKFTEALSLFSRALDINPENSVALGCIIQVAYSCERVGDILKYIENHYEQTGDTNSRVTLAGCLISLNRHEEAKVFLEEVLAIMPDHVNAQELYSHIAA